MSKLTEPEERRLINAHQEGIRITDLSLRFKICRESIYNIFNKYGIKYTKGKQGKKYL